MTWPTEHGGGGRPGIERIIVAEEMMKAGAPISASWIADRRDGSGNLFVWKPRPEGEIPACNA